MYGKLGIGTGGTRGTYGTTSEQKLFITVGRRCQNKQPRGTCVTPPALPGDISLLVSGGFGIGAAFAVLIALLGNKAVKVAALGNS